MTLQPDHPHFTAAALGEVSPEELAGYEAAVSGNPALQFEEDSLLRTANRLRSILQAEPVHTLTPSQRKAVFAGQSARPIPGRTSIHPVPVSPPAAISRRHGRVTESPWKAILATAGAAAAIVLGIFLFPALSEPENSGNSAPSGISGITLIPGPSAPPPSSPALGLPLFRQKETVLPPGRAIEGPATFPIPQTIVAAPPEIEIIPDSPAKVRAPSQRRAPAPGSRHSAESIGSPPAADSR